MSEAAFKSVYRTPDRWAWSVSGPGFGEVGTAATEEEAHRRADAALEWHRKHPMAVQT